MLTAVLLELRGKERAPMPGWRGRAALRALAYELLCTGRSGAGPRRCTFSNGSRPFTIGAHKGMPWTSEITVLDEEASRATAGGGGA